jgi:hypothetical protein
MAYFENELDLSQEEIDLAVQYELARRMKEPPVEVLGPALVGGSVAGKVAQHTIHAALLGELEAEFAAIRNDPDRQRRQGDQMVRTYERYLDQGGDPVEYFIPEPGKNFWAAGQTSEGQDVVWYDPTAPHPAVMAHELGHVDMNHSENPFTDPLAFLQTSGLGRASGVYAGPLGAAGAGVGAYLGGRGGNRRNQYLGTAVGGALGTLGGSGNFAYEIAGASGRALDYLPEDVEKLDAAGDLAKAGLTYGMAGPVAAATAAAAVGSGAAIATHPGIRRYAGALLEKLGA